MFRLLFVIAFIYCGLFAKSQNAKVGKEPTPKWVTVSQINYSLSNLDDNAEDGYVDLDYEMQICLPMQMRYCKTAIKILSESGVENSSEISIDFDPSYQTLVFHSLKIIRGNQIIDKLASTQFKIVQQEKDLDKHLYDGSLTAISFLEDVRKGDILEYSYSRKGFNPIFSGRYSGFFDVQYSVPVYNLLYRLVVPAGRTIIIKNRGTDIKPFIQQSHTESVYEWKLSQIEPLHAADHLPGWYDPYPAIMVSEFTSWKEVSHWAQTLYPFNVSISSSLQNKILDIQKKSLTDEERTSAALRFVQDEIRCHGPRRDADDRARHHPHLRLQRGRRWVRRRRPLARGPAHRRPRPCRWGRPTSCSAPPSTASPSARPGGRPRRPGRDDRRGDER